jgi:hypothetical protein
LRVPAPKEGPPYKIGDIIGYSEEGLKELYVGKIVLFTKWGNMAIYDHTRDPDKALEYKKSNNPADLSITVHRHEKLEEGEYRYFSHKMALGDERRIYILDEDPRTVWDLGAYHFRINIYSKEGKYIKSIPLVHSKEFPPNQLYVDSVTGDIYISSAPRNKIIRYNNEGEKIAVYEFKGENELGEIYIENGKLYSSWQEKELFKVRTPKITPQKEEKRWALPRGYEELADYINKECNLGKIPLILRDAENKILKKKEVIIKIPPEWVSGLPFDVLKVGKEGDIYIIFERPSGERYKKQLALGKYNINGELVTFIRLKGEDEYWTGIEFTGGGIVMDEKNSIYQLWTTKEGVYVIKWDKL